MIKKIYSQCQHYTDSSSHVGRRGSLHNKSARLLKIVKKANERLGAGASPSSVALWIKREQIAPSSAVSNKSQKLISTALESVKSKGVKGSGKTDQQRKASRQLKRKEKFSNGIDSLKNNFLLITGKAPSISSAEREEVLFPPPSIFSEKTKIKSAESEKNDDNIEKTINDNSNPKNISEEIDFDIDVASTVAEEEIECIDLDGDETVDLNDQSLIFPSVEWENETVDLNDQSPVLQSVDWEDGQIFYEESNNS